jgi:hypothetical protein
LIDDKVAQPKISHLLDSHRASLLKAEKVKTGGVGEEEKEEEKEEEERRGDELAR